MNAIELLHHIQNKGIHLSLLDGNRIKAYPASALNNDIRSILRSNKIALIAALRHEHIAKQSTLGYRVDVLKILLSRLLKKSRTCGTQTRHDTEERIGNALKEFNYDLEKAIDYYRKIAPKPEVPRITCQKCGYRPLFCACGRIPVRG